MLLHFAKQAALLKLEIKSLERTIDRFVWLDDYVNQRPVPLGDRLYPRHNGSTSRDVFRAGFAFEALAGVWH